MQIKTKWAILLLTVLAACGGRGGGRGAQTVQIVPAQKTTIQVSARDIVIQGPPGFCVDNDITEVQGDNAFVLLANCRVTSPASRASEPAIKALLTASISGSGQGTTKIIDAAEGMDSFFRSEDGRTALSRDSDPGSVQVLDTFQKDNIFFIRATDTSTGLVPGASVDYWRAYFDLSDQIISVSVIGFKSDPIPPDVGLETLRKFTQSIRVNNGGGGVYAAAVQTPLPQTRTAQVIATPIATPILRPRQTPRRIDPTRSLRSIGILRRLFN